MKGTALIVVLMAAAALAGELTCPEEQAVDWHIEQLIRHEDCDKFYKCTFGEPVEQNCYGGLLFNLDTWECDWPQNVECGDRNDPNAPAPEVEESEEVPEEEVVPEEEAPEEVPEEEVAPEEEAPEESPEEEVAPEEEASEESPEEEVAPEEGDVEFLPNGCPVDAHVHWLVPGEVPNEFYTCVWWNLVPTKCPSTLVFDVELQGCVWPQAEAASLNKHLDARQVLRNTA